MKESMWKTTPWARVSCDQISKFAEYVSANFDHIFMAIWHLQRFKHGFGCVALDVISVDDDLNDTVPNLSTKHDFYFIFK